MQWQQAAFPDDSLGEHIAVGLGDRPRADLSRRGGCPELATLCGRSADNNFSSTPSQAAPSGDTLNVSKARKTLVNCGVDPIFPCINGPL